jgi:hypothetical protein
VGTSPVAGPWVRSWTTAITAGQAGQPGQEGGAEH